MSNEARKKRDQEKKERARQREENIKKVAELTKTYFSEGKKTRFVESKVFITSGIKEVEKNKTTNPDKPVSKDQNSYGKLSEDRLVNFDLTDREF